MRDQALKIVQVLQDRGHQAVFAGGCVRDRVLKLEPQDYDIATSATPDQVEALFEHTVAVGKAFGVIVVIMDGFEIEVATFRSDSTTSDGRRPDSVTFTSIEEDARRRDLTINGMFFDPVRHNLLDFIGGMKDLQEGFIRLIGVPEARIVEDKLRMLRVVRFAARFKFKVVPSTLDAVRNMAPEILKVSAERIGDELTKILRTGNYRIAFDLLFETDLMHYILPEIEAMKGIEQPVDYHPEGDVLEHTIMALESLPADASDELRMGVMLHDVGKPSTQTFEDRIRFSQHELRGKDVGRELLRRLKFSNEFTEHVTDLIGNHMKFMHVQEMRISKLKRFMAMPKFEEHLAVHRADCMSSHKHLLNYEYVKEKFENYEPEEIKITPDTRILTGNDLLALGFKSGPLFRTILTDVEDQQLEGTISDRDQALKYVSEKYPV